MAEGSDDKSRLENPPQSGGGASNRPSSPPPDLRRERDEILQSFTRGARLTEQFAAEHERMRERLLVLEAENAQLRTQVEADDAVRRLLEKIEQLESEKRDLLSRTERAEKETSQFNARFSEVETEFANLANLFVASNQLHASLSPRGVVRRIKEVLAQLVGAESYAMYLINAEGTELVPIASEGVPGEQLTSLRVDDSRVGEVVRSGAAHVDEERTSNQLDMQDPPAIVPLLVDDSRVGAIAIFATLGQKPRFTTTDFELFKLLGQHAAAALVSACLFSKAERKLPGLEAFLDLSV
jgi:GAF domain-containing protein